MENTRIQGFTIAVRREGSNWSSNNMYRLLQLPFLKQGVLLVVTVVLLLGSTTVSQSTSKAQAANPGPGNSCSWYSIHYGDTLSRIALSYRTTVWTLARVNYIRNVNLIFAGQSLCVPYSSGHHSGGSSSSVSSSGGFSSGVSYNGYVRWYDYQALGWSSQSQVAYLLRSAAARYGLPASLLEAIAWQESGWSQHVISRDGGIGVMQIMPYTAMGLNTMTGIRHDPYKLADNIELGAIYLHSLWFGLHGNITLVISAYNEGGWNVIHRGIFNWRYVDDVRALMYRFG
ncbi:MAG TPA: transglycosylase SLT domain-containing protein [Ktedonobacteraceae bacterium]|nr:transglycosylase SLT domain-containing protein [Ktedonobacteraceae bacterium]